MPINQALSGAAANDKSYAQALVVGNQLFITSDSSDVNLSTYGTSGATTGHLTTVDITGGTATTVVSMTPVANGAGSVVNDTSSNTKSSARIKLADDERLDRLEGRPQRPVVAAPQRLGPHAVATEATASARRARRARPRGRCCRGASTGGGV